MAETKANKLPTSLKVLMWAIGIFIVGCSCYWAYQEWVLRVRERITKAEMQGSSHPNFPTLEQKSEDCATLSSDWIGVKIPAGYRIITWPKDGVTYAVRVNKNNNRVHVIIPGKATENIGDDIEHLEWTDPNTSDPQTKQIYWRMMPK